MSHFREIAVLPPQSQNRHVILSPFVSFPLSIVAATTTTIATLLRIAVRLPRCPATNGIFYGVHPLSSPFVVVLVVVAAVDA